jgi:hypothetical protein
MSHNLDLLTSEWHELADQSPEVIDGRFTLDGQAIVDRVLREVMGISPTVEISSSSEFVQYVLDLRSNERAWSVHLGDVILAAQQWLDQGDAKQAKKIFDEFEANCPWKVFVDIARDQRSNTVNDIGE